MRFPLVDPRAATPPLPQWRPSPPLGKAQMRSVGLLGGSFNPAHEGHRQISLEALKQLQLDEIWWLVSPQNPLKAKMGMAPYSQRMARAAEVADHPRIRISDCELRLGTRFTVDIVSRLTALKHSSFVYLMGADNLVQLPLWHRWRQLASLVPIAVFDRSPYSKEALKSKAAQVLGSARLPSERAAELKGLKPPVWCFVHMRPHPASSTSIRRLRAAWWRDNC